MKQYLIKISIIIFIFSSCTKFYPGPDKTFSNGATGAVTGGAAGAVTGFQIGSGLGPGAVVGAGLGFAAGAVHGLVRDRQEVQLKNLQNETVEEKRKAIAQKLIMENYERRMRLHPSRDIYPADIFFVGGSATLRSCAKDLIAQIVELNKDRMTWSRFAVTSYVKSLDHTNEYAINLAKDRAISIANELIHKGFDQRRIENRAVLIEAPILIDDNDHPARYNQAIEFIPIDR